MEVREWSTFVVHARALLIYRIPAWICFSTDQASKSLFGIYLSKSPPNLNRLLALQSDGVTYRFIAWWTLIASPDGMDLNHRSCQGLRYRSVPV